MQQIIFKKRITRCDNKSNTPSNRQRGHTCLFRDHLNNKFGRIVLNLARHLVSVHKMNRHCSKFEDLIAESLAVKPFERYIRVEQTHKILPSISSSSVALMKTVSPQHTEHEIGFSIQRSSTPTHCRVELADKNCSTYMYNFSDEDHSESFLEVETSNDTFYPNSILPQPDPASNVFTCANNDALSIRFIDSEKIIREFHSCKQKEVVADEIHLPRVILVV